MKIDNVESKENKMCRFKHEERRAFYKNKHHKGGKV